MGGGHDHALPFHKLSKAEYHSQKEGGKVAMASSFSPPGKWRSVVIVTLHHSSRRKKEGNHASIARGRERHWGR